SRRHGHVDQRVESEEVDLAAHQVGNARLRHAKPASRLGLCPSLVGNMFLERDHERRAKLHVLSLGGRILDRIPYAGKTFFTHRPDPSSDPGIASWPDR